MGKIQHEFSGPEKRTFRMVLLTASTVAVMGAAASQAAPIKLLLETDEDAAAGSEVYLASFESFDDVLANSPSHVSYSQIDIEPQFSVDGLAYDGQYRLLIQSENRRDPRVYIATYATFDDLLRGDRSEVVLWHDSNLMGWSYRGLAFDGQFRTLVETRDDRVVTPTLHEVLFESYATFDDLLTFRRSRSYDSIPFDVPAGYSIGGFAYDGQYRLLWETDSDVSIGLGVLSWEVALTSYSTFDDLITVSNMFSQASQMDLSENMSIRGLAYETPGPFAPTAIPAPATGVLFFGSLALLPLMRRIAGQTTWN